ncbi:MAG: hypothetical protein AAF702_11100 [Chloroflexota bacterium]
MPTQLHAGTNFTGDNQWTAASFSQSFQGTVAQLKVGSVDVSHCCQ